ncbi:NADAR family protein [Candidatus Parcubacteria bacterium]|nr:NADAR family protein [Candidatus Parcubacteria bacterium]
MTHHGFDNDKQVLFYENEFYCLSNFSSFMVEENRIVYMTSEHLYHCKKFTNENIIKEIIESRSAHDTQKIAIKNIKEVRPDWNDVRIKVMKDILVLKVNQHPYVKKKLLDTGNREIIENSWKDDFWGWGENKNGQNMLGKLWMEVRSEIA